MSRNYTAKKLHQENLAYAGTGGISSNCRSGRFQAAFRHSLTGQIALPRFDNGKLAPMHLFCGLPDDWVERRDDHGQIVALCDSVEAGFVRDGVFYTRDQAAALV
jgi:hypothetical protein